MNRSVDGRPGGELEDFAPTWSDVTAAPRRLVGWEGSEFFSVGGGSVEQVV